MNPLTLIIDASNVVFTHWAVHRGTGYPPSKSLCNLARAFADRHGAQVAFAFDAGGRGFRHELFAGYKAGRSEKDSNLVAELSLAFELCSTEFGNAYRSPGIEADDIIATLTHQSDGRVVICSKDKDLRQLLERGRVTLLRDSHRIDGQYSWKYFTEDDLLHETGLSAAQWADYQALVGESDGWKGADGVGDVAARKLLMAFCDLEGVRAAAATWPHSLVLSRAKVVLNRRQVAGIKALDIDLARAITRLLDDVCLGVAEPVAMVPF